MKQCVRAGWNRYGGVRIPVRKKKVEVHRRPRGKAKRSFIDAVKEDLVLVGVRGCREEFERGG